MPHTCLHVTAGERRLRILGPVRIEGEGCTRACLILRANANSGSRCQYASKGGAAHPPACYCGRTQTRDLGASAHQREVPCTRQLAIAGEHRTTISVQVRIERELRIHINLSGSGCSAQKAPPSLTPPSLTFWLPAEFDIFHRSELYSRSVGPRLYRELN